MASPFHSDFPAEHTPACVPRPLVGPVPLAVFPLDFSLEVPASRLARYSAQAQGSPSGDSSGWWMSSTRNSKVLN